MYLIMKCEELNDQWECDCNRTPLTLTDDWQKWIKENSLRCSFEVYEYKDNKFICIKEYGESLEAGMCFVKYPKDSEDPIIIAKYPNYGRSDKLPKRIQKEMASGIIIDECLSNCGYIVWEKENEDTMYAYTEYEDNIIYPPF